MDIRDLQRLIDRNSNEINSLYLMNGHLKELLADLPNDEPQMIKRRKNLIRSHLKTIAKLSALQKILKKEIANEIWVSQQETSGFGL